MDSNYAAVVLLQTLVQQKCEVLAELLKRCLDEERLLLESIINDVTTIVLLIRIISLNQNFVCLITTVMLELKK